MMIDPIAPQRRPQLAIQDLADFYIRWPQLRRHVASVLARQDLSDDERVVLEWLQTLADRIGPEDLL